MHGNSFVFIQFESKIILKLARTCLNGLIMHILTHMLEKINTHTHRHAYKQALEEFKGEDKRRRGIYFFHFDCKQFPVAWYRLFSLLINLYCGCAAIVYTKYKTEYEIVFEFNTCTSYTIFVILYGRTILTVNSLSMEFYCSCTYGRESIAMTRTRKTTHSWYAFVVYETFPVVWYAVECNVMEMNSFNEYYYYDCYCVFVLLEMCRRYVSSKCSFVSSHR